MRPSPIIAPRLALVAAAALVLAACSSSPSSNSSGSSGGGGGAPSSPSGSSGSGSVGVFSVHFSITGYYTLSGSAKASGNGNTCAQMAENGDGPGGGINEWDTPFPQSVKVNGHTISELQGTVGVQTFRTHPGTSKVTDKVNNSSDITIDTNTFDAYGEGATGTVTVNGDGSGSFTFKDAPDQSLAGPGGTMATVSGEVTWSCADVPPSQAPSNSGNS